jgi:hypothetical protein
MALEVSHRHNSWLTHVTGFERIEQHIPAGRGRIGSIMQSGTPAWGRTFAVVTAIVAVGFALGLCGGSAAHAAPYLTVRLLGSVNGGPYSSEMFGAIAGSVVSYKVQVQLAPEGTTNPFAGPTSQNRIITSWLPSDGTQPTGLNTLAFSIVQSTAEGIQCDFDAPITFETTGGVSWGAGLAASAGTVTARGNGNDDLIGVILNRATGTYDGIAGDGTTDILEILDVAGDPGRCQRHVRYPHG